MIRTFSNYEINKRFSVSKNSENIIISNLDITYNLVSKLEESLHFVPDC